MNIFRSTPTVVSVVALCAAAFVPAPAAAQESAAGTPTAGVEVTVYPILVVAPLFGASVDLPSLPSRPPGEDGGGESGAQSASTDVALNAAYMAGIEVRSNRWVGEVRGQWAALSASRQSPRIAIDTDAYFFLGKGGVRLIDGFWVTGGVRRVSVKLTASLTLPIVDRSISGSTTQALWDPLVGVEWRHRFGSVLVDGSFDGGGFGVGTDADVSGEAHLGWRFVKHVELRLGYSFLYYKWTSDSVSIGSFQRTLVSTQTLHGPVAGIGIVF
jgi:hypothetical protein